MPRNSTSASPALRKPARTSGGKSAPKKVAAKPARAATLTRLKATSKAKPATPVKTVTKLKTVTRGKAAAKVKAKTGNQDPVVTDWQEDSDTLEVIPGVEDILDRPAANYGADAEARRRIEMLREERMLQQALSDVFDL